MKIIVSDYYSSSDYNWLCNLASAVDFWALGVCLYQFLVGVTPFSDDCPRAVISNILNYRIVWPEHDDEQIDEDAINVIKGLLSYDPTLRLQLDGKYIFIIDLDRWFMWEYLDLRKEAFFNTTDWENLPNTPAPFIPVPDNDSDTFYFEGNDFLFLEKITLSVFI
jgi:serine/threonine-protein kinase greatwall